MLKFDKDKEEEKYLRFLAKVFVSSVKRIPQKEAEQLAYEALKLLYVATLAIKELTKKK